MSTDNIPLDNLGRTESFTDADVSTASRVNHTDGSNSSPARSNRSPSPPPWSITVNRFGRGVQYALRPFWLVIFVVVILMLLFTNRLNALSGLFKGTEDPL